MGLRINTNVQSLNAQRTMSNVVAQNDASIEKLSSGSRINKSADDAAGLAISEKVKADIKGLTMAKRNASDGISLIQTAEGGLNEIGNVLSRLRELAVQGASDTIGDNERGFLNKEFSALKDEITRISRSTEFNGTMLLMGDQSKLEDSLKSRSNPGPLEVQVGKNWSRDVDGDLNAPAVNAIRINVEKINTSVGEDGLNIGTGAEEGAFVSNKVASQNSISMLDQAINTISGHRADLGAIQSRLGSTIANLAVTTENAAAANSRVRDTDFAEESAKLTQTNILKQANIAVLSQANQSPQAALRLLG